MNGMLSFVTHSCCFNLYFCPAALIWFEIWRVVDQGQTNFDFSRQISKKFRFFPGKFSKNSDFFRQILKEIRFFQAISQKFRFSRQKLLTYSYFWANYSISLHKSPLSNILPVAYMIRYNNISRPVHDLPRPSCPKSGEGSRPPTLPGLTPLVNIIVTLLLLFWKNPTDPSDLNCFGDKNIARGNWLFTLFLLMSK